MNSPIESVTTVSAPARIPGVAFGSAMSTKRRQGDAVQYALAVLIFCGLPEVTRRRAYGAIDIVPEALPAGIARLLGRFNAVLGALACAFAGWVVAGEALRQFDRGLLINAANPIPRWLITAIIALGFGSAARHVLRMIVERQRSAGRDGSPLPRSRQWRAFRDGRAPRPTDISGGWRISDC